VAADSPRRIRALVEAYRAAHYDVVLPTGGTATLRIGAPAPPALRGWLGAGDGVFLTACNPRSEPLPQADNERRMAELRARLDALAARVLEGAGHGAGWREPSLLVAGLEPAAGDALARAFGQNAVVRVAAHGPAVLRLLRDAWRATGIDAPDDEWAPAAPGAAPP
jgi:hypothetical protein